MRSIAEETGTYIPMSDEEKASVRQQMNRLLETNHFKNSRRYPALFRFIVEETLEGRGEYLKERLLGVQVFDRPADYDTATDPIVRVTIAEIRKRIAQYYHEEAHEEEMRIELLPGRYAPEFRARRDHGHYVPYPDHADSITPAAEEMPHPHIVPTVSDTTEPEAHPVPGPAPHVRRLSRAGLVWLCAAVLTIVIVTAGTVWRLNRSSAIDQLWGPLLAPRAPILMAMPMAGRGAYLGPDETSAEITANRIEANNTALNSESADSSTTFRDHINLGENVVFSDVLAATRISELISERHGDPHLRLVTATSLYDLRQAPSIMIGGLDNPWTLRALAHRRYSFVGSDQSRYKIRDDKAPGNEDWSLNLNLKYSSVVRDYAIVARIHNELTGQPEVIIAGIGMSGTAAAGEFVADPKQVEELRRRVGAGFATRDFEAVLGTEVVSGTAGPPRILAVEVY